MVATATKYTKYKTYLSKNVLIYCTAVAITIFKEKKSNSLQVIQ